MLDCAEINESLEADIPFLLRHSLYQRVKTCIRTKHDLTALAFDTFVALIHYELAVTQPGVSDSVVAWLLVHFVVQTYLEYPTSLVLENPSRGTRAH